MTASLVGLFSTVAYSQDDSASETITIHELGGRSVITKAMGACTADRVAQGDTAFTFGGTFRTTSPNPIDYQVDFDYGGTDGSAKVEGIEPTTNIGAWETTSDEDGGTARLKVGVSSAQALEWTFGLFMTAPGLAFYNWQIRVAGNLGRDDTCTFEIIVLPGRLLGQVFYVSEFDVEGLDGVRVTVFTQAGDTVGTTLTRRIDANQDGDLDDPRDRGWYLFDNLIPGMYQVQIDLKEPWVPSDPASGGQGVGVPPGGEGNGNFGATPDGNDDGSGGGTVAPFDFGDLVRPHPTDSARCPTSAGQHDCYQTLAKDDGAKHGVREGLSIGILTDAEADGQPDVDAAGDDQFGNDEEGLLFQYWPPQGGTASLAVGVTNDTPDIAFLNGWIDINNNGQLGDTQNEHVIQSQAIAPMVGFVPLSFAFPVPRFPMDGIAYFRLRLTTVPDAAPRPFGSYQDGEVEDYLWTFSQLARGEFGDAPEDPDPARPEFPWGYPTRVQNDGARHGVLKNVRLGDKIDPDPGGQPTILADGDDTDAGVEDPDEPEGNDDDGIVFGEGFTPIGVFASAQRGGGRLLRYGVVPGESATITPLASVEGVFDAWFDWNRNGSWEDAGEHVFDTVPVEDPPEYTPLKFTVPSGADLGFTFARFRFNLDDDLETTGFSLDGEVEDYLLKIIQTVDVTITADSGPGSLRQSIIDANQTEGVQVIRLRGVGGAASKSIDTILLESPLPEITDPLVIDGGGTAIIDGSGAGTDANGLVISAAGTVVSGLTVQNFARHGILVSNETNGGDDVGPVAVHDNTITGNGGAGIRVSVESARPGPTISANSIFDNGGLAIDHSDEGVTNNADNNGDFPDFPVVTSVVSGSTTIEGTYSGLSDTGYVVDFFAGTRCDPSGHGEAQFYVGSTAIVTDQDGNGEFSVEFDTTIANRHVVTATATSADGTTSELSQCSAAVGVERVESPDLPADFRLSQNYPNPFNPATTISFEVAERALVRLEVFNTLGQVVETLLDGTVAPGHYQATFDAGGLPSGLYYYRLQAGSFVETRAMVLLR